MNKFTSSTNRLKRKQELHPQKPQTRNSLKGWLVIHIKSVRKCRCTQMYSQHARLVNLVRKAPEPATARQPVVCFDWLDCFHWGSWWHFNTVWKGARWSCSSRPHRAGIQLPACRLSEAHQGCREEVCCSGGQNRTVLKISRSMWTQPSHRNIMRTTKRVLIWEKQHLSRPCWKGRSLEVCCISVTLFNHLSGTHSHKTLQILHQWCHLSPSSCILIQMMRLQKRSAGSQLLLASGWRSSYWTVDAHGTQ